MLREWSDRTEAAVDAWTRAAPRTRERAAKASIAAIRAQYPEPHDM
jgi:hypothetical protein